MASENVITLTEQNFASEVESSTVPVVVDFWAEWCAPCRALGPILDAVAQARVGSVKVGKVNVDESPALAAQFNVRSIPTMLFVKDGQVQDTHVGVLSKDGILRKIDALGSAVQA